MEIFPMKMMEAQGDSGAERAMGGLVSSFLSSMLGGMLGGSHGNHRHAHHGPRIINFAEEPTPAVARAEEQEQQEGHCCCRDIRQHCKQVHDTNTVQGVFAVTHCLAARQKAHHDIDSSCVEKVDQTVAGACLDDIESFCPHVKPGKSGIHTCLFQHRGRLTDKCSKYMHVAAQHLPKISAPKPVTATKTEQARRVQDRELEKVRATAKLMQFQDKHAELLKAPPASAATKVPPQPKPSKAPAAAVDPLKNQKKRKLVVLFASCVGVVVVAAFIGLVVSRRRRAPADNSHYVAMLI
jgi:hypothetical protein